MKKIIFVLLFFISSILNAQSFINGDFEDCTAYNCLTVNNTTFNSYLSSVFGFGGLQFLDIFFRDSCSFYAPESGLYCTSIETSNDTTTSTAFSLELTSDLLSGNTYIISYYDKLPPPFISFQPIQVEIGYSVDSSSFGSSIYLSPSADSVWKKHFVYITPNFNTHFITVRGKIGEILKATLIDNFSFDTTGLYLDIEKAKPVSFSIYPNPCKEELHIQLQAYMAKATEIKIYNVVGHVLLSEKFKEKLNCCEVILDMRRLSSGIYFVELTTEQGRVVKKIIKSE